MKNNIEKCMYLGFLQETKPDVVLEVRNRKGQLKYKFLTFITKNENSFECEATVKI